MKQYMLKLEPLTVLHIGTGNTVEPHEYTIYNKNNSLLYLRINYENIFEAIKDEKVKQKLLQVLTTSGDFIRFRSLLQEKAPQVFEETYIYGSHVTREFAHEFKDKFDDPNNQLAVLETYRPPYAKVPFIPGSSIKGAIRTAILNKYAEKIDPKKAFRVKNEAEIAGRRKVDTNFQQSLLNYKDAKEDPFRILRITDGKVKGKRAMIVGAAFNIGIKNGTRRDSTIPIYMETIRGLLAEGDAEAEVKISIQNELVHASEKYNHLKKDPHFRKIPAELRMDEIIKDCNYFFKKVWAQEFKTFHSINETDSNVWVDLNEKISEIGKKSNEFLLRIGRFSHFEAVTVEKFRRPPKGYGKSRTVFSYDGDLLPLGWVRVTVSGG